MPRKKRFEDKETKVIGLRVPIDMINEIKEPLRGFADYYIETGKTLKDLLKEIKELKEFKLAIIKEWEAKELTPERFKELLMSG